MGKRQSHAMCHRSGQSAVFWVCNRLTTYSARGSAAIFQRAAGAAVGKEAFLGRKDFKAATNKSDPRFAAAGWGRFS